VTPHLYPHQIAYNVLPQADNFLDDGDTLEEWKLVHETRRIMHEPNLRIGATCVRVPVLVGHSEAVHVGFTRHMSPEDARHILVESPGIKVLDDPVVALYPYPWMASGQDEVLVGRVRPDESIDNGLALWVVSDNLRKGAALNAVQIAEEVLRRGWL
jgi:aspartate-semialdehyde dehydrogenase